MSVIKKPLMMDDTGRAIVEALTQKEMTQTRIAEINAAADTAKADITAKTDEQAARIPEVTALAADVGSLKDDIADLNDALFDTDTVQFAWKLGSIGSGGGDINTEPYTAIRNGDYPNGNILPAGFTIGVDSVDYQFAVTINGGKRIGWRTETYTVETEALVRIAIRKADVSALTDTSIANHLVFPVSKKSKLIEINQSIDTANQRIDAIEDEKKTGIVVADFEQGTIELDGSDSPSTVRIRSISVTAKRLPWSCVIPAGFQTLVHYYDADGIHTGVGTWKSGEFALDEIAASYRFVIRNTDGTEITPEDFAGISVTYAQHEDGFAYVGLNGSDDNDGSKSAPFATIQKAVYSGAHTIIVESGTYKGQRVIVDDVRTLAIYSADNRPFVLDNTEEITLSSDSTSGLLRASKQFGNESNWHKVFITNEKTPLRTGTQSVTYNVMLWENDAKMIPVLTLAECKTTEGSFFYDGTSVYVNTNTAEAKYRYLLNEDVSVVSISNVDNLTIVGMELAYSDDHSVVLKNIKQSTLTDCRAYFCAYGGGFRTLNANVIFNHCESYGVCSDGFGLSGGGHTVFNDCYSHDNGDDGISHHAGCTGAVYGGEYYMNGKGGITPSYGSEVDIYNAICHDNLYGIYFIGNAENNTDKINNVVGCVAYDNTRYDIMIDYYKVRAYATKYSTKNVTSTGEYIEILVN